ncbi:hypothetical protein BDV06DRAFT_218445 [Aspergillus oleicola]
MIIKNTSRKLSTSHRGSGLHRESTSRRASHKERNHQKYLHRMIKIHGPEIFDSDWLKDQEAQQVNRRASVIADPNGYDVYIGLSKEEYYDEACDTKIIFHNRSTNKCQWFYTWDSKFEDPGTEPTWKREENQFPCGHFLCDSATDKMWMGVVSAVGRQRLLTVWGAVKEQPSRPFVKEVITGCMRENILPAERVMAALEALDELGDE